MTCPSCGERKTKKAGRYAVHFANKALQYPLAECANCHHVFAAPAPSQKKLDEYYKSISFWDDYGVNEVPAAASWYEQLTFKSNLWERYKRAEDQFFLLQKSGVLSADSQVLELGAGYAPFLYHCAQAGYTKLAALEPATEVCDFLKKEGIKTYPVLLEEFITLKKKTKYDLIVFSHTLEHLTDPNAILIGLKSFLKKDGVLLVEVPYQDHLLPYHQGFHLQFFNENSLSQLLKRSGYANIQTSVEQLGLLDTIFLKVLYLVYGKYFAKKKKVVNGSGLIEILHVHIWRKVRGLFGLKANVFISKRDVWAQAQVKR